MDTSWLLGWWNLIFLVPLAMALAYLFAYTLSGWTFGEVDLDADVDADVDVDVDVDVDMDVDADVELEVGHGGGGNATDLMGDVDHDVDHDHDGGGLRKLLVPFTWIGVGRVPLSLVLMNLALVWGVAGLLAMQGLRDAMGWAAVWIALPIAGIVALLVASTVSQLMARYMPLSESSARPRSALVGRIGTIVFPTDADSGTAVVQEEGDRYQVAARAAPGLDRIAAGTEVVLVRYDADRGLFLVRPTGLD